MPSRTSVTTAQSVDILSVTVPGYSTKLGVRP